jgi:HAD superfamily hydrolase (TIGR01509 family)
MLKNIIFDIGNVLISFKPIDFLSNKFDDEVVRQALYNTIFKSKEWLMLDRGTLTEEEATSIFCMRQPHLQRQIRYVMENWHEMHIPMNESVELLKHLKNRGYHIYLLSNYHRKAFRIISEKFDFIRDADGKIISSEVKLLKPEDLIYKTLLSAYSLIPEECLFLDDSLENIEAANKLGINGVFFKDAQSIYAFIDNFHY